MNTFSGISGLFLGLAVLANFSPAARADEASGQRPVVETRAEQAPPSDIHMSEEACLLLIQQTEPAWQIYSGWSRYRADRDAHWNRDNLLRATSNIKDFSRGLTAEERSDLNDFLNGAAGDTTSVTRLLDVANTRIARLSAVRENDGGPDPEGNNSELYRVQFKITQNPRAISIKSGGRYRYDYDYNRNIETERKYVPVAINLSTVATEQTDADAAGNQQLARNLSATLPDSPHYATPQAFMVGQKLVPAACFIKPKPAPPAPPSVSGDYWDRRRDDMWYRELRFDRGFRSGGARR